MLESLSVPSLYLPHVPLFPISFSFSPFVCLSAQVCWSRDNTGPVPQSPCISTLDISDNGETPKCINKRKLLSAPNDLRSVSFPSVASVAFDSACTLCSFQGWMLISSVSFLPSPDTLPSNTCCWARTLTSREGTCSQTERDKHHRVDSDICIHLFVWQKCV